MQIDVNGVQITLTEEQLSKIKAQTEKKSPEERFLELIAGIEINKPIVDFEKYPNSLFWFNKEGQMLFEYDFKNDILGCDYSPVWLVFYNEYNFNCDKTQAFIKTQVEKNFKLKGITLLIPTLWRGRMIEEHFKLKGVTTL